MLAARVAREQLHRHATRGSAASDHVKILEKTVNLMTSKQMEAFKVNEEPKEVQTATATPASAAAA